MQLDPVNWLRSIWCCYWWLSSEAVVGSSELDLCAGACGVCRGVWAIYIATLTSDDGRPVGGRDAVMHVGKYLLGWFHLGNGPMAHWHHGTLQAASFPLGRKKWWSLFSLCFFFVVVIVTMQHCFWFFFPPSLSRLLQYFLGIVQDDGLLFVVVQKDHGVKKDELKLNLVTLCYTTIATTPLIAYIYCS